MSPRVIQLPMSGRDRRHYLAELKTAEHAHPRLVDQMREAYRIAHRLACEEWNARQFIGGPAEPSPTLHQAIFAGCVQIEVKCKRCNHESLVNLTEVMWPPREADPHAAGCRVASAVEISVRDQRSTWWRCDYRTAEKSRSGEEGRQMKNEHSSETKTVWIYHDTRHDQQPLQVFATEDAARARRSATARAR